MPKSSEQFSRMTVMQQWVPDWRSTDAEGFNRQGKCHPHYRQQQFISIS